MLDLGPLVLGTVLTLAAVVSALVVSRRAESEWAPVAVVGGGTVLGLAALGLAIAVTTSATDADDETPLSTAATLATETPTATAASQVAATASTSTAASAIETATTTPTPVASTPTPTPAPTESPEPPATEGIAGPPPTRYIDATEGGVRWRSACATEALLGGWWPNGTAVEVMRAGPESCEGWSLVRSGSLVSWVNDGLLADTPPGARVAATATATPPATRTPEATPTPAAPTTTPTPVVSGAQGSYAEALNGWIGRLRDIEAALDSNFDRAVASNDWAASSTNATRLGTAAVAVRTEIEQTAPFIAELAPECRDAMAPLGEMAAALVRMAGAYQEWLGDGLVDNDAGLRVGAQRDALNESEVTASAALETCA